jgi:hypothetical protein
MMKVLCENRKHEQVLLAAYESPVETTLPVSPVLDDEANAATGEERVRQFLKMKTTAIAFRKEVALALDGIGVSYRSELARGPVITDFLIEKDGKRVALECRANVKRDPEKSLVSARIIRDELKCDQVFIVVPEYDGGLRVRLVDETSIRYTELKKLVQEISKIFNF